MQRKKIVMVMGVQRSGTTALFDALFYGPVIGFNETPGDNIYDNYYLRPEPEIRDILQRVQATILLKPISETFRRTIAEVFEEYAAYDLDVIWIYRDPVNATHSIQIMGFTGRPFTVPELAEQWKQRNQIALESFRQYPDRTIIVRYEDLAESPAVLYALGKRLGMETYANFRGDSGRGRREMEPGLQSLVDVVTRETRQQMDACRFRLSGCDAIPDIPRKRNGFDLGNPFRQLRQTPETPRAMEVELPNTWVVLRYPDVASLLNDTEMCSGANEITFCRFAGESDPRVWAQLRHQLEPRFSPAVMQAHSENAGRHARRVLQELAEKAGFDLIADFAQRLRQDLPAPVPGDMKSELHPGVIAELQKSLPYLWKGLPLFLGNAVDYLLSHPEQESALRNRPDDIPAFTEEILRLFPPVVAVKRYTLARIEMGDVTIPAGAHMYLALFAANRDQAVFDRPDEVVLHRSGPPPLTFTSEPLGWLVQRIGQAECEAALRVLVTEFPPLVPDCSPDEVQHSYAGAGYGPTSLPVRFAHKPGNEPRAGIKTVPEVWEGGLRALLNRLKRQPSPSVHRRA